MPTVSPNTRPYIRKQYYIKKDFQKKFIAEYTLLTLLCIIIANILLYYRLIKGVDDAFYKAHIGITTTSDVVLSPLFIIGMIVVFVSATVILLTTVVNTWKVGRRLNCLAEGIYGLKNLDLTVNIKSYQGDQLTSEVSGIFNRTVKHLNKKIGSIKSEINELETAALSLNTDRVDAVEQLIIKTKSIEDHLSAFKLSQ